MGRGLALAIAPQVQFMLTGIDMRATFPLGSSCVFRDKGMEEPGVWKVGQKRDAGLEDFKALLKSCCSFHIPVVPPFLHYWCGKKSEISL